MQYPLNLSFKIVTFVPQIFVKDAAGMPVLYVRQKLFKLKEDINVYADPKKTQLLYNIKADRIIDWSASYHFTDRNGMEIGSVKRHGTRSLWKAHYRIFNSANPIMTIKEANPFIKVADFIFSEIPLLGMLSGFVFHPAYIVNNDSDGRTVMRLKKLPSMFESSFVIEKEPGLEQKDETTVLLSLLMMLLLERSRG